MFEKIYTTKMSSDKKKLQNRFAKIRSKAGRLSKLMSFIVLLVIALLISFITIIIANNTNKENPAPPENSTEDIKNYAMTESEFTEFVHRPLGATMADLKYIDHDKLVFHYGEGLFIMKYNSADLEPMLRSELDFVINLKKLNLTYAQQGSSVLDIKISKDGKYAYLSSVGQKDEIKDFEEYIVHLDTGFVEKGSIPENAELFTNYSDTFTTLQSATNWGWHSDRCIILDDKTYFLTCKEGTVKDIGLAWMINNDPKRIWFRSVFNYIPTLPINQLPEYSPSDIKDIRNVELVYNDISYPLADNTKLKEIETMISTASKIPMGGTACPFDADLIFIKDNGEKGRVTIATDSCAVYKSKEVYYDYSDGDNSDLLWYFGLDFNTLHNLSYPKSYADNAEIALLNFFSAFESSDFEKMKTVVSHEFIERGYIDDGYKMCYGLTEAKISTYSEANKEEFLKEYYARPQNSIEVLTQEDIELLSHGSDQLVVFTVIALTKSEIKGEKQAEYNKEFMNVICKREENGKYLVYKLLN